MQLLRYVHSADERLRITELLESRGIPVLGVEGGRAIRNPVQAALFVCINAQYPDALALLSNEHHEVREPVDVEAFKREVDTVGQPILLKGALIVLAIVLVAWVAIWILRWSSAPTAH